MSPTIGADAMPASCDLVIMNVIREDEAVAVRQSGMSVIWCPANSMNWGFGRSGRRRPQPELRRGGVNVALGSDTPALTAYLLARDRGYDDLLLAEDFLEMATLGGAQALRMGDRIGSLEAGKRADIVIRTTEVPESQPGHYPIQTLLLASRGKSIDTVIVDGRIVVRGGHSTLVDEGVVYATARERATRMARDIDLRTESRWPVL